MTDYRHRDGRAWDAPVTRRWRDRPPVALPALTRPTTAHEKRAYGAKLAAARAFLATLPDPFDPFDAELPAFLRRQAE